MDVLVESTRSFEQDLARLNESERGKAIQTINKLTSYLPSQTPVHGELHPLPTPPGLNGYDSSLYILRVAPELGVILAVDEDPIFGQVILTLFRVVQDDDLDTAYTDIATSLYQDLYPNQEPAQIS